MEEAGAAQNRRHLAGKVLQTPPARCGLHSCGTRHVSYLHTSRQEHQHHSSHLLPLSIGWKTLRIALLMAVAVRLQVKK